MRKTGGRHPRSPGKQVVGWDLDTSNSLQVCKFPWVPDPLGEPQSRSGTSEFPATMLKCLYFFSFHQICLPRLHVSLSVSFFFFVLTSSTEMHVLSHTLCCVVRGLGLCKVPLPLYFIFFIHPDSYFHLLPATLAWWHISFGSCGLPEHTVGLLGCVRVCVHWNKCNSSQNVCFVLL